MPEVRAPSASVEPAVPEGAVSEKPASAVQEEAESEIVSPDAVEVRGDGAPSTAEVKAPSAVMVRGDKIVGIKADSGEGETVITIVGNGAPGSYSFFHLVSPDRLVLDIWGVSSSLRERSIDVNEGFVRRVRIGDHSDRSRVVIEFSGGNVPRHSIDKVDNALMVTFGGVAEESKGEGREAAVGGEGGI